MLFTNGETWHLYTGSPGYVIGTSFMFRRSWWVDHPFEDRITVEDHRFRDQIPRHLVVVDESCPTDQMYATMHDGNTSKRDVGTYSWKTVENPEWVTEPHPAFGKEKERASL
jgi:hypothetical protein